MALRLYNRQPVVQFDIQVDERQLAGVQRLLAAIPRGADRAIVRAVNKTARTVRSRIVKKIAARITLTQKAIREGARLYLAKYNRHFATVTISGYRIPLIRYRARQTKKGVTYQVMRAGTRKRIRDGFIATVPSGHTGVFERRYPKRLPIFEHLGPSIASVFSEHEAADASRDASILLAKNLDVQVELLLKGAR